MAKEKDTVQTEETPAPKMVDIMIELHSPDEKDVYVAVNGEDYLIKRGEHVQVPDYIAEVLHNSQRMRAEAMKRKTALAERRR